MATSVTLGTSGFFKKIENMDEMFWAGWAFIAYVLSLLGGSFDSGVELTLLGFTIDPISFALWGLFGLITLACLYMAFFDMWIHGLWLLLVYFLAGVGIITLEEFAGSGAHQALGVLFLFLSVAVVGYQVWDITKIRVKLHLTSQVDDDEAFSLGLWYVLPFLFLILSLLAFYSWYRWFDSGTSLIYYYGFEVGIILVVILIMWIPQNVLFYGQNVPMEFIQEQREHGSKSGRREPSSHAPAAAKPELHVARSTRAREPRRLESCSHCSSGLRGEAKGCPHCGHNFDFGWCSRCELYNYNCPDCGKGTVFGKDSCEHCGASLSRIIECPDCHRKFPLRRLQNN